jgi:hypothetical protein
VNEDFLREMVRIRRDGLIEEAARARLVRARRGAGRSASRFLGGIFPALAWSATEPVNRGQIEGACCA